MPQLNPEFFVSQLFWLVLTFSFLFIFLWRISLPRISSVLEKRESKINEDINSAKKIQAETEEIQNKIDIQLKEVRSETSDMIKKTSISFNDHASKELFKLDSELDKKINESHSMIENNKNKSLKEIHNEIYTITKLTLSKLSSISPEDSEIKQIVDSIRQKEIN